MKNTTAEKTSVARARGCYKENMNHFFDLLELSYKYRAVTIFNVDECGLATFCTVVNPDFSFLKIISREIKRQLGTLQGDKQGANTIMVWVVSATALYIPPIKVFKRKNSP